MKNQPIITRFAPSPTGFLHIGGARTALFNWLFARNHKGKMLLRIEDTDRKRSHEEAIEAIIKGLNWLGLNWDGDIVYQHKNQDKHFHVAHQLLKSGHAYKCYCTQQELEDMRLQKQKTNHDTPIVSPWRDATKRPPPDRKPSIRFKTPSHGVTIIHDTVQGDVTIPHNTLDDLILLRSDDTPTYMLSVVVDDHEMNVTNIIRGDDHLTNSAKQILLYNALGWKVPTFSHIPLIHGKDGHKLSKRHGALDINIYKDMGYLASALCNYLVRLGWSYGDKEYFTISEMVEVFCLENIGRAPARLDIDKLNAINAIHLRELSSERLFDELLSFAKHANYQFFYQMNSTHKKALLLLFPEILKRSHTLKHIIEITHFLFDYNTMPITDDAFAQHTPDNQYRLSIFSNNLHSLADWQLESLKTCFQSFIKEHDISLASLAKPMRAALTGMADAFGIYDICFALGRQETLKRLDQWCKK